MAIEYFEPIQRYDIEDSVFCDNGYLLITEDDKGEWCKWEDVEKVIKFVGLVLDDLVKEVGYTEKYEKYEVEYDKLLKER